MYCELAPNIGYSCMLCPILQHLQNKSSLFEILHQPKIYYHTRDHCHPGLHKRKANFRPACASSSPIHDGPATKGTLSSDTHMYCKGASK